MEGQGGSRGPWGERCLEGQGGVRGPWGGRGSGVPWSKGSKGAKGWKVQLKGIECI